MRTVKQVNLEHLKILLQTVHPEHDHLFSVVMLAFITFNVVTENELADELRLSVPTIKRWVRGKNLPHRSIRPPIHKFLSDKLDNLSRQS